MLRQPDDRDWNRPTVLGSFDNLSPDVGDEALSFDLNGLDDLFLHHHGLAGHLYFFDYFLLHHDGLTGDLHLFGAGGGQGKEKNKEDSEAEDIRAFAVECQHGLTP